LIFLYVLTGFPQPCGKLVFVGLPQTTENLVILSEAEEPGIATPVCALVRNDSVI